MVCKLFKHSRVYVKFCQSCSFPSKELVHQPVKEFLILLSFPSTTKSKPQNSTLQKWTIQKEKYPSIIITLVMWLRWWQNTAYFTTSTSVFKRYSFFLALQSCRTLRNETGDLCETARSIVHRQSIKPDRAWMKWKEMTCVWATLPFSSELMQDPVVFQSSGSKIYTGLSLHVHKQGINLLKIQFYISR